MTLKKHSKRLSLVLRHKPEQVGLTLDDGGWVDVEALLNGLTAKGWGISRGTLQEIVDTNDKKRFTLSGDGKRIRAAQGHSVDIVHDLAPTSPPEILYHGTATRFLDAILRDGLKPMSRQHVHLSADEQTAQMVGQRHGKPIILQVATLRMQLAGFDFYQADNGVWLTDHVPADFISKLKP